MRRGLDLQGVCLFPALDMLGWHTGVWVRNGICDVVATRLDEDPFGDPVKLPDVVDAAHRLNMQADKDWS